MRTPRGMLWVGFGTLLLLLFGVSLLVIGNIGALVPGRGAQTATTLALLIGVVAALVLADAVVRKVGRGGDEPADGEEAPAAITTVPVPAPAPDEPRRQLESLRAVDALLVARACDPMVVLQMVLDALSARLGVAASSVLLCNTPAQTLEYALGQGFASVVPYSHLHLGEGPIGSAVAEGRTFHLAGAALLRDGETFAHAPRLADEGFGSYHAVPLVTDGVVRGVLELFRREATDFGEDAGAFVGDLAVRAALAIERAALREELAQHEELARAA